MIQIRINGKYIDLFDKMSIGMEIVNPVFDTEVIKGSYSYPFDLPLTSSNSVLFSFPQHLDRMDNSNRTYTGVEVLKNGAVVITGTLYIRKVLNRRISANLIAGAGSIKDLIAGKTLQSLAYGGVRNLDAAYPNGYIRARVAAGTYDQLSMQINNGAIGMFRNAGFVDRTAEEHLKVLEAAFNNSPEELATIGVSHVKAFGRNFIVYASAPYQDLWFNNGFAFPAGVWSYQTVNHSEKVAMHMQDLIDKSYPDTDYVFFPVKNPSFYSNNPDYDGYLNRYEKVYGKYYTNEDETVGGKHSITPFPCFMYVLKQVFKEMGYEVFGQFLEDKELQRLVFYNTKALDRVINGVNVWNFAMYIYNHLPNMSLAEFLISLRKLFRVDFFFDLKRKRVEIKRFDDMLFQTDYIDITTKIISDTTIEFEDNEGYAYFYELDTSDTEVDGNPSFVPYIIGEGKEEIKSKISTCNTSSEPAEGKLTSVNQPGSSNEYGQGINTFTPRLLFYRGPIAAGNYDYPYGGSDELDGNGFYIGNYTLYWHGDNGLYNRFHRQWTLFMARTKVVTIKARFTIADLVNLDITKKYRIQGVEYLVSNISLSITHSDTIHATLTLYKL